MKRIAMLIICAIVGTSSMMAARQNEATLRGKIFDKASNEPAGWATVALMAADSTVVAGATCAEDGTYEIKAAAGRYRLTASLIGYVEHSQPVSLAAGVNDLAPIYLDVDAQVIAGATVTERVKLVEMKIDKVVMNVSQSAFAQGSNALELMKKAPGVTIDKDGNVKLNGKSVSVWIDGRPSYMDGKSLEALLRSTNSESIEKFELMEHPSSKYDAAGQGGIINIKTKRNLMQGFSGSMGLGGGGMYFKEIDNTPWQESYWLNLAYRTEKTNTFFSIYEGFYNTPMKMVNDFTIGSMSFNQVGRSTLLNFYHNYNVKIGNDWFIDDKNTLGVIAYIPGSYSTFNSKSSTTEQSIGNALVSSAVAKLANQSQAIQHTLNLNYTHVFDEKRSAEITGNLDYYHNMSADNNSQFDTTVVVSAKDEPLYSMKGMDSDQLYDIYSAKADYQTVMWQKYMMEAGAKWALSHTDNKSLELQAGMPDLRSDFIYNENVAAAYISLAGQLGAKVSFKAGLRGEYTHSFGDWKSSGEQTTRSYFDLFPTAYVGFTPNEDVRIGASFTRRINRPQYGQLNPTKTYVDAKTYTKGNPDILPQYSHEIGLNFGYGQHLSMIVAYNGARNILNQIPSFDNDGTQYLTWGNVGTQKIGITGFNVSALPIGKWLQWTLSANALYIHTTTSTSDLMRKCWAGQAYTDLSFILPRDWKIDVDAYATSPMVFGYYNIHSTWSSNLAVKKSLLDDRLTLTFKVDDIFRSSSTDIDLVDENNSGTMTFLTQKYYNQKVIFDITWSFGKAQKPVKQRKVGNLEEMSRVGGGNGSGLGK